MHFSRLRNVVASKQAPVQSTSDPGAQVAAEQPRRTSITDDWEELSPSSTQRSRSSSFGDDVSIVSWHSSLTLSIDRQQAPPPARPGRDVAVAAAVSVPYEDPPPDYELIAPSTQGYSTSAHPRSTRAATKETETSREDPPQRAVHPPLKPAEKQLRRVSSDATLVDPKCAPPQRVAPDGSKKDLSLLGSPIPYRFPTFTRSSKSSQGLDQTFLLTSKLHELAKSRLDLAGTNGLPKPQHNAITYHTTLSELIKLLDAVTKEIIQDDKETETATSLHKLGVSILAISAQAKDLEPILQAYSKHFISHGSGLAAGQYPLNSCLWDWMEEAKLQLLSVKEDLESAVKRATFKGHRLVALDILAEYLRHSKKLWKLHGTMAEFLPVIKGDFDLFNTHLMTFPTLNLLPGEASSSARRQAPYPAVARMRRQLYDLKDQIDAHHTILKDLRKTCPLAHKHDMNRALKSLTTVSAAITTILTNNASEWMESDLASGGTSDGYKLLPYADFVALDADVIHDVAGHLKQMQEGLGLSSVPLEEICFTTTPLRNHQLHVLLSDGSIKELLAILDFTQSLLMPNTA